MLTVLLTIAFLHWVVLLIPGANFLLVGQLAASGSRAAACMAALGISFVTLSWASLAILGLGVVFSTHPMLRLLVQIAGGIYLCHLGVKLWQAQGSDGSEQASALLPWAAFRLGLITNALNPKTALFFASVFASALPQDPSLQMLGSAVLLVYLNALVWHLLLALAFSHQRVQAGYGKHRNVFNRVCGALVGAFGVKLLWAVGTAFVASQP